jgi:hypothetical protein
MKIFHKLALVSTLVILDLFSTAVNASQVISDKLKNSTYTGIYENAVTLKEGHWQGKPFVSGGASRPTVGLVEDFQLSGDLNDDGTVELIVVLWENSGGSGTRTYLAVMSVAKRRPVNIATALIGDRVKLLSGRIRMGRIELDVIQQSPADPACCPTQKMTRSWTLDEQNLTEGPSSIYRTN